VAERLALVLAGGGIAGVAWETGFLLGVREAEPAAADRLLHADVLLGTSAGSVVAAQISSGLPLTELYARQISASTHERAPHTEIDDLIELIENVAGGTGVSVTERLRAIGKQAVAAPTVTEEVRRAVIAQRLPSHRWPDRRLPELSECGLRPSNVVYYETRSPRERPPSWHCPGPLTIGV
jgi:NTE family protein